MKRVTDFPEFQIEAFQECMDRCIDKGIVNFADASTMGIIEQDYIELAMMAVNEGFAVLEETKEKAPSIRLLPIARTGDLVVIHRQRMKNELNEMSKSKKEDVLNETTIQANRSTVKHNLATTIISIAALVVSIISLYFSIQGK